MNVPESVRAEYEEQGFSIIRDVIPKDLLEEIRAHVGWLTDRYPDLRPEHLHHPLIRNDAFWVRLVSDPRLVDIAEFFLGPDVACFTAHYICKPPQDGQPVLWHQDGSYWNLDPMRALTVWLAVDRCTTENGCLRVIPGSHRMPLHAPVRSVDSPNMLFSVSEEELVREWSERNGVVDIELDPGDVEIHHPNILHCSGPNTSPRRRCGLDIGYIPATTRITSDGLYLNPLLVRGEPVAGINSYRRYPSYVPEETIPFAGMESWGEEIAARNARNSDEAADPETPLDATHRMIERLHEGTVKR
ncbi:phytanoyl-CoA dioxygenase family protein [Kitasatospora sp. NBC_01246]|uniref:phytanoyl-CoA dioxygenase family protein n=1 Tax=Kitasatospora sp. NBC_01246 TaxID=2903570 RepID=UPI002E332501|nr:phytanoyl-CoA dioxygenase family protein [Kitasatospora sp. NBC_01246]